MKLKRATYRHIEAEIYAYDQTLRAINDIRADIIYGGGRDIETPISHGYTGTSQVERRATRLADSLLLQEMQRITEAIAGAYAATKTAGRRVLWIKYDLAIDWQPPEELLQRMGGRDRHGLNVPQMAYILGIDESTFHRYRTGFVYAVAERLGWW